MGMVFGLIATYYLAKGRRRGFPFWNHWRLRLGDVWISNRQRRGRARKSRFHSRQLPRLLSLDTQTGRKESRGTDDGVRKDQPSRFAYGKEFRLKMPERSGRYFIAA
jgi:hypothetical protein